jgi:hypothetical protein
LNCVEKLEERETFLDISSQIDSMILRCIFNKHDSEVADNGLGGNLDFNFGDE